MKTPFLELTQTDEGWQATFALQVYHRKPEDWLKMRWGFNAGALLEEALDRSKLFVESQAVSEAEFRTVDPIKRTLALRGINLSGEGLQMALLGKVSADNMEQAQQNAINSARELHSTLPQDFISVLAETQEHYQRLCGRDLLDTHPKIAQILRAMVLVPSSQDTHFLYGPWQASARSNEQIWRALSNMPKRTLFNITMQPTFFYEGERRALLELKKQIPKAEQANELTAVHIPWIENIIKRRLAAWKKFFIIQVHVAAEGELDENLIRSVGSALTRDANDQAQPGFQIKWPDSELTESWWLENILALELVPAARMEDLADSDEASAVFRFPYFPEAGLPGANFIPLPQESSPPQTEQGQ